MSDAGHSTEMASVWQAAVEADRSMAGAAFALHAGGDSTIAVLKSKLAKGTERHTAISILAYLGSEFTRELVRDLTCLALSHAYALQVRECLGRLPHDEAQQIVPPAVWAQLEETDDYDAYRRMAELLKHLGLGSALQELCARAAASPDEDIREVAEDFA